MSTTPQIFLDGNEILYHLPKILAVVENAALFCEIDASFFRLKRIKPRRKLQLAIWGKNSEFSNYMYALFKKQGNLF